VRREVPAAIDVETQVRQPYTVFASLPDLQIAQDSKSHLVLGTFQPGLSSNVADSRGAGDDPSAPQPATALPSLPIGYHAYF